MGPKTHPPSLPELESWLKRILTDPKGVASALSGSPQHIGAIVDGPPIGLNDRLGIYSDAYFERLLESLGEDFSASAKVLGELKFREITAHYLMQRPSTSPNIGDLGSHFPEFVRSHPSARQYPFLPDLCLLEWNVIASIYSDRLPPASFSRWQAAPESAWPEATLALDPTVRLLELSWPVDDLWRKRNRPKAKMSLPAPKPRRLLLYRGENWVEMQALHPLQWLTLRKIQEGSALGAVCEAVAGQAGDIKTLPPVMAWFREWVGMGVIKKVSFPGEFNAGRQDLPS